MKVTMADVNKRANLIINEVVATGEPALIFKHGKPIAEIRPLREQDERDRAIDFICGLDPVPVDLPLEDVIRDGRKRGL